MLKIIFVQDIKKLDADQIAAKEAEELQKERRELLAKLKSQEKKVDYFERAKRLEEIPLIQAYLKEKQMQDQMFWEQQEKERIAAAIAEREQAVATRDRLARMKPDKEEFLAKLKKERNQAYEEKLKEFEKLLAAEREKRLAERKAQRKEDRRAKWIKQKQEEADRKAAEQRRREEEEIKRLEEIARKEREEREKAEQEEKERKRKEQQEMLDRMASIQKAREEEIERKLAEERESTRDKKDIWRKGDVKKESSSWRASDKPSGGEEPAKNVETWRPCMLIYC